MTYTFPHPDRIRYDSQCFTIEGSDLFLYSGAFHYFRCPKELWGDRFRKLREAGFNAVESYVPWNYHERQAPASVEDFSRIDLSELDEWMSMAEDFGFYTIIRPGPYICAEWAGGGYPQWLVPLFKPEGWKDGEVWLQTDDPVYLAWNKHWYDAVCRVVAPHQITRKAPGQPGVILFQIENEYERLKWISDAVKTSHLAALARQARGGGIEVPLVTCWTRQTRNSSHPDLHGIFDFINSYPKWEIGRTFQETAEAQRLEQPDAPTGAMELQAGWYSEIGGQLSRDIDGVAPVQTQNLTLFCIQIGYTVINYYMLVGGTNFDDWASREATASYDFFAPLREGGGVGEKYRRLAGIGAMLEEHGVRLARSVACEITAAVSDPAVQVALRRAHDGTRFYFVRTEDRSTAHKGSCQALEPGGTSCEFDFELEPFGSLMLAVSPDGRREWYPRIATEEPRPSSMPASVEITEMQRLPDPVPGSWTPLAESELLEARGIVDYHFHYYRIHPPAGADFTVKRLGGNVISRTMADGVFALAGGRLLAPVRADAEGVTFSMPDGGGEVVLLHENVGLHHHTVAELEREWPLGIRGVEACGSRLPMEFASTERELGLRLSRPEGDAGLQMATVPAGAPPVPDALLVWYRLQFELPETAPGVFVPWHLNLDASGNGFLYLNGHCIGRTWEAGPQREFYLPECWLKAGTGQVNTVAISLCPAASSPAVRAAAIKPGSTPPGRSGRRA